MNVNSQAIAAMSAITISREYGSGGGEIAARLARRLGWQLIDHAVVEQTARQLEVRETEVEKHDEDYVESDRPGILSRILEQLTPSAAATGGGGFSCALLHQLRLSHSRRPCVISSLLRPRAGMS